MNITVPQNKQTKIELEELADLKRVMISAGSSMTIMGLKQDGLLGAYNLTNPKTRVDGRSLMNMVTNLKLPTKNPIFGETKMFTDKEYTGHEVFSYILPDRLNKSNSGQKNNAYIRSGNLVSGRLDKKTLKENSENSIMHLILDEYGVDEARDYFDNAQKIINQFNMYYGFSVGMIDTVTTPDARRQLDDLTYKEILKTNTSLTEYENNPDMLDEIVFENSIKANLQDVMNSASKIINTDMLPDNSIGIMANSGSKGSDNNTGQMIGLIGQQILEGHRIPKYITKRSLPYFPKGDETANGRGFIQNSFLSGMNYPEFAMHCMTAREGLIDSAIKTADTGYTQRKLIKSLEDVQICYDGTVRNATNSIIQFIYGDCGTDTTKQYKYPIDMLLLDDKALEARYKFTKEELHNIKDFTDKDNDEYFDMMVECRDMLRKSQVKTKMDSKTFQTYIIFMLPINLTRIIDRIREIKGDETRKLNPKYIIERIDNYLEHNNTRLVCVHDAIDKSKSFKINDEATAKIVLKIALHNAFAPKRCINEYKLTKDVFDYAIDELIKGFKRNIAEAGEMVGIIGVQALMPPLTQLTLNTFHQSGVGGKGHTTLGVPRLKELLALSRSIKAPNMSIYFNDEYKRDKEYTHRVSAYIKQTNLKHMKDNIDVYYDPNPNEEGSFKEKDHIGKTFHVHSMTANTCQQNIDDLPWLIRIELNKEKLLLKDVTLLDIQSKFCQMWATRYHDIKKVSREEKSVLDKITRCGIVGNTDNDEVPVIHIRFDMINFTIDTITDFVNIIVEELKIKGVHGIKEADDPVEDICVSFNNPTREMNNSKEFAIYTDGINMYDIRYINGIDISRTTCNDVMLVYEMFGIEAARIALLREITTLLERANNTFINYQHLSIIVDLMTRDGFMISIDRHGMGRTESAPLGKVSFEKPIEQLISAAVFNEKDPLKGVSARIMTGNVIRGGTGMCDLILDIDLIEKSEYVDDETKLKKGLIDDNDERLMNEIVNKSYDDVFTPIE